MSNRESEREGGGVEGREREREIYRVRLTEREKLRKRKRDCANVSMYRFVNFIRYILRSAL